MYFKSTLNYSEVSSWQRTAANRTHEKADRTIASEIMCREANTHIVCGCIICSKKASYADTKRRSDFENDVVIVFSLAISCFVFLVALIYNMRWSLARCACVFFHKYVIWQYKHQQYCYPWHDTRCARRSSFSYTHTCTHIYPFE